MGSQSVTDFSAAKKKRIQRLIRSYSPSSSKVGKQVLDIGTAAVGTLGTGTANEFLQAMSSSSAVTALRLILSLWKELKEAADSQKVLREYGVGPEIRQPFSAVSASLTTRLSDQLSASQEETESTFAAKDAIPKTIADVVSTAFHRKRKHVEVDREKFVEAFRRTTPDKIATAFYENVVSALVNLVLDASRGRVPPGRIAELKQRIRKRFVPKFVQDIKGK